MIFSERAIELKTMLSEALVSEIAGQNVVLLDVPYYSNIGDTLIWQGTRDFLREYNIKCLVSASKETFDFRPLPKGCVILLQGGGNYGDIWIEHQKFREKVVINYPGNKIIILPQTIFFRDIENLNRDAEIFFRHSNLHILARDRNSFDLLAKHYSSNNIALMPDMAFCIDFGKFKIGKSDNGKVLFFERKDVEFNQGYSYGQIVPKDAERHEWPSMEFQDNSWRMKWLNRVKYRFPQFLDKYWDDVMRPYYVRMGIDFISKYEEVYTTRLHGAILSFLLGKKVTLFDNSYGKNSAFFKSWLSDVDSVKLIETNTQSRNID